MLITQHLHGLSKESALTDVEQAAIEAHGLFNLADFLPKKPSESELTCHQRNVRGISRWSSIRC